jgi:ankyrin repeat protein
MYTAFFPIREQETIDLLIKHGADVHATNNQGQSLADMFFKQGQIDMVEYLIKKYGVTLHLEEVVSDNSITLASYSRPQFLRLNCLHYLIKHFKQQLAVNLEFCQKLLLLIIKQNDVEMLDVFFATNLIDPNYQDKIDGWTPLMHAVKARSFTVFKYLIEKYKVDTTLQNEDGKTAFDIARANEQIIDRGIFSRPDPFIKYINEIAGFKV